jgi:hypothetical protein
MRMQARLILAAATMALALGMPVAAAELKEDPKAFLELFTSQGCSSCPPADELFANLAKRPDIIALAYHVDYWDYIGWADTFATKDYSDRQRAYARSWGSSRIFTPQLVVNGSEGVVASHPDEVTGAVQAAMLALDVELEPAGDTLKITIPGRDGLGEAVVWLVCFRDRAAVTIERGENEGKTISYAQIVMGRQALGVWDPRTGASLKLPLKEVMPDRANGLAIIVQQEKNGLPGPILGAASFQR